MIWKWNFSKFKTKKETDYISYTYGHPNMDTNKNVEAKQSIVIIIIIIIIYTANRVLPGGSGTTIRHNTQITQITQNNTQHSNKTQHTKLHKQ
jgi:hypothetical protein